MLERLEPQQSVLEETPNGFFFFRFRPQYITKKRKLVRVTGTPQFEDRLDSFRHGIQEARLDIYTAT